MTHVQDEVKNARLPEKCPPLHTFVNVKKKGGRMMGNDPALCSISAHVGAYT